jgi:predicted acyl esterase
MPVARAFWNRRIRVHDGIELAADVLLPPGAGPFPTVVIRTPYGRSRPIGNPQGWIRLVGYGYALVSVDVRGRNDSDGEWIPQRKDPEDGHDVIEWAARQPWSNGKVGMVGGSYEGLTQWWTALGRPPHLACIAPFCIGGLRHPLPFATGIPLQYWLWWMTLVTGKTMQYPGGPAWEAWAMHAPLSTLDGRLGLERSAWQKYVSGEVEFFSESGTLSADEFARIDVPALIGVGWWDDQDTFLVWQALQQAKCAGDCRLLVGAWDHAGNFAPRPVLGGLDVSASVMDTIDYVEQFLALHLKGERKPWMDAPRCRVFCTGENRWDSLDEWPHPLAAAIPWYLASDGDARTLDGNGSLSLLPQSPADRDSFVYDPAEPARDLTNLAMFVWSDPPLDWRYLQRRQDALVYTSEPLPAPLMVSGRYQLVLFVSCDRPDTDLYASLSDVHADGRAINLAAAYSPAALRLRFRDGPEPTPMAHGEIYEIRIAGSWMHHEFKPGHRLRVTLNSGIFPMMARNAGTGLHWAEDEVLHPQVTTIHHSEGCHSRLLLPVVAKG